MLALSLASRFMLIYVTYLWRYLFEQGAETKSVIGMFVFYD